MAVLPSQYVEKIRELQESFQLFDVDRNGAISAAEFTQVLAQLGQRLTPEQAAAIVKTYDVNGDGEIEFAEFLVHQTRTLHGIPEALRSAFGVDADGDGFLRPEELKRAIEILWDGKLGAAQVDELASKADVGGDGRVALGELVHLLMDER